MDRVDLHDSVLVRDQRGCHGLARPICPDHELRHFQRVPRQVRHQPTTEDELRRQSERHDDSRLIAAVAHAGDDQADGDAAHSSKRGKQELLPGPAGNLLRQQA